MLCSSTDEVTPGSSSEPGPSSSTFTPYSPASLKYGQIICRQQEDPRSSSVLHTSYGTDDVGNSPFPGSTGATDTGAQTAGFTETPPTEGETIYEIKDKNLNKIDWRKFKDQMCNDFLLALNCYTQLL